MDWAYNRRVEAATEMIAVFSQARVPGGDARPVVPQIRVLDRDVGEWTPLTLELEWGFQPGSERTDFDGRLGTHVAVAGRLSALGGDTGTTVTDAHAWPRGRPAAQGAESWSRSRWPRGIVRAWRAV